MVRINFETIKIKAVEYSFDLMVCILSGHLSGRVVNWFAKWSSASSFFTKSMQMNLDSAASCFVLFATIDRIAYYTLSKTSLADEANKPAFSAFRMTCSAAAAITIFNAVASRLKISTVESAPAAAIILTAMVIYNQIMMHLDLFNSRYT